MSRRAMLTTHFSAWEMRCRCGRAECDAAPMQRPLLDKVELLRVEWGKPLSPTSARRCEYWNREVGGAPASQHLSGNAVDFFFPNLAEMESFAILAEKFRFAGIGKGRGIVHLDERPFGMARWEY